MNKELELYKLIMTPDEENLEISYIDEFGWVSDTEFFVWINAIWFHDFIKGLSSIFGYSLFDDGGIKASIFNDCICIDLEDFVGGYGIDLEEVFPKSKYKH